jgi:hypothetical protein
MSLLVWVLNAVASVYHDLNDSLEASLRHPVGRGKEANSYVALLVASCPPTTPTPAPQPQMATTNECIVQVLASKPIIPTDDQASKMTPS